MLPNGSTPVRRRLQKPDSEAANQRAFIRWLALAKPHIRRLTFSIPNGGMRNIFEMQELKRQGLTNGVCDIFICIPNGDCHGLFIELKSKTGKVSPEQAEFIGRVIEAGYAAIVCYSFEEAQIALLNYIEGTKYA